MQGWFVSTWFIVLAVSLVEMLVKNSVPAGLFLVTLFIDATYLAWVIKVLFAKAVKNKPRFKRI